MRLYDVNLYKKGNPQSIAIAWFPWNFNEKETLFRSLRYGGGHLSALRASFLQSLAYSRQVPFAVAFSGKSPPALWENPHGSLLVPFLSSKNTKPIFRWAFAFLAEDMGLEPTGLLHLTRFPGELLSHSVNPPCYLSYFYFLERYLYNISKVQAICKQFRLLYIIQSAGTDI